MNFDLFANIPYEKRDFFTCVKILRQYKSQGVSGESIEIMLKTNVPRHIKERVYTQSLLEGLF